MITYVITLDEDPALLTRLGKAGLNPVWFRGVRGATAKHEDVKPHVTPLFAEFGAKSTIGCALSHLKVWKTFLSTSDEWAIVMEDDVILVDDFETHFADLQSHVPTDADVVYLGCFGCDSKSNFFTCAFNILGLCRDSYDRVNQRVVRPRVALGLHAYMVSRKGAKQLVKHLDGHIYNHIDMCIQGLAARGIVTTYAASPRLAYQTSTDTTVAKSSNVSTSHPMVLNNLAAHMKLDEGVRLHYIMTASVARFGPFTANAWSIIFFALGVIARRTGVPFNMMTGMFVALSFPDLVTSPTSAHNVAFHYTMLAFGFCVGQGVGLRGKFQGTKFPVVM